MYFEQEAISFAVAESWELVLSASINALNTDSLFYCKPPEIPKRCVHSMSAMDDAGLRVVAHFNRHGDVAGQQLFYLYTVEVEKQLKEAGLLAKGAAKEPVKHGISILDKKPRNEKVQNVTEKHRYSEANARYAAKRVLMFFRSMNHKDRTEKVQDTGLLKQFAKQYKVKPDHVDLFVEIVTEGVKDVSIAGG